MAQFIKDPFKKTTDFHNDNFSIQDANTSPNPAIPKYIQNRWYDPLEGNKRKDRSVPYWIGLVVPYAVGFAIITSSSIYGIVEAVILLGKAFMQAIK